ncbi:MAG: patatin-like phospholipase family protein [Myxococcota bacterium]
MAKVAFVLSGGGSLGAVQVGMARALYERGIVPDLVVGTSAGALNGTFLAARPTTLATIDGLLALWRTLDRQDLFPLSVARSLLGLTGQRRGLLDPSNLRTLVQTHANIAAIEDATTELHIVATNLLDGREVLLSKGDVVSAIMASAAIPGVFPPVERGRELLVDGGVSNNTPISQALKLGATTIYVLPTGTACTLRRPPRNALGVLMHAFSLVLMQRLLAEVAAYDDTAELVLLPAPCSNDVLPIDFRFTQRLHDTGYADARALLDAR